MPMTYKELLTKVNKEIPEAERKQARVFVLQEKKKGQEPDSVWDDCLFRFGRDQKPGLIGQEETKQENRKQKKADRKKPHEQPLVQKPERVQGEVLTGSFDGLNISDIENKIYICLEDFKTENNIKDDEELKRSPQSTWMAFCIYNGNRIFKGTKLLKETTLLNNGSCMTTTNNQYNIDKIITVLHLYEYLCNKYNKIFNDWSACAFLGLNDHFVADHREELTLKGFDTRKKNEQFLTDTLTGSNRNPTGVICALNHIHGWTNTQQAPSQQQVNVSVYPVLSTTYTPKIENKG